jgi:hypothetical protein
MTTCNHLRPGLIALLYFMRWKIEMTHDVFKNKFKVRKAWGTGETCATIQAHFVALLHNPAFYAVGPIGERRGAAKRRHQAKG